MVTPSAASVVLIPFPFSDLSQAKLRPAIVLASAGREDWVLCQVTSNAYADVHALEISDSDFLTGGLQRTSYARPGKLFTAHGSLIVAEVGTLKGESFELIIEAVIKLLRKNTRP
ncbi:MAG TPA: type II toxin-antitoxin system PemK/MazF family toxin [Pyrinomonadaceae bacterium]|nr:type II toxin-antitoxin system PemK/MazF family toxin [Pyrinomonadaceae bacterium]